MDAAVIPLHPISEQRFMVIIDRGGNLSLFTTTVQAGFPSPASDYPSTPIDLNTYSGNHPKASFCVMVEGDSMSGAGIFQGDLAIVDRDARPQNGNVVLVYREGGYIIKRLVIKKEGTFLCSENEKYPPIQIKTAEDGIVWGVVKAVHKTL